LDEFFGLRVTLNIGFAIWESCRPGLFLTQNFFRHGVGAIVFWESPNAVEAMGRLGAWGDKCAPEWRWADYMSPTRF